MSFYVGKYLISEDTLSPKHDRDSWAFPAENDQHMADTSNVEELYINVEDMDVLPTQIQFGADEYASDEGFFPDHKAFDQFYVRSESFYLKSFVKGINLYREFYVRQEVFKEFYPSAPSYYVQAFTPVDFFSEFYMVADSFIEFYSPVPSYYLQSFTPIDFFYAISGEDC